MWPLSKMTVTIYLPLFKFPAHTPVTSLPHSAFSRWPGFSHYTDRREATHTKLSPPQHHNRAHVSPWAHPPFLPRYHWDEGPSSCQRQCLRMQSSSQPSPYSSLGWGFPDPEFLPHCWIISITVQTALVIFHLRKNSPWTLYNSPTTTTFLAPFCTATLLGWHVYIHPLHLQPPFLFSSLLNPTALLTQLKPAPTWLLPGCTGASSSDHLVSVHATWSLRSIWQTEPIATSRKFFLPQLLLLYILSLMVSS